jgi:integrase
LTDEQIGIAEATFKRLERDADLITAVDHWLRTGKPATLKESPRLDEALDAFVEWLNTTTELRPKTKENLRGRVSHFIKRISNLRVTDVLPEHIEHYLAQQQISPDSKDAYCRAISSFFTWCMKGKRHWCVNKDKAFDLIRHRLLIETQAEHFLEVLKRGTVSTNAYLRKTHNFALDMNWLPAIVIPRRQWPAIHYKEKRALTLDEHQRILAAEVNSERKAFYQLCWHLGGSQGDLAVLKGEDIDWVNHTVSFFRKKTGVPVLVHLGEDALHLLEDLPGEGFLFPYMARVRAGDRSTEFKQRMTKTAT